MTQQLRIIPLGGLGEVGKNMIALVYDEAILIVDAGNMFPENDMLGIDMVIPDFGYLRDKVSQVVGIIITHGHEDHVGALPYVLREINAPVYATPLTCGLIEAKLEQHTLPVEPEIHTVRAGDTVKLGPFEVELFAVNHSIPDNVGLAIATPLGTVVHSGDFKFDYSPVHGQPADFATLARLGSRGVLALLSDSTNAESPGFTPSERSVEPAFDEIFRTAQGRIIVASFASLLSRIQQVVDCAARWERKIAFAGRSMLESVEIAKSLGYLSMPEGIEIDLAAVDRLAPHEVVVMATGSQGEPQSALARMAAGRYKMLKIQPGDTVVHSAQIIPGNEELAHRTINKLLQRGAEVIYGEVAAVHVSGHASQEEQKLLLSLLKPKYFIPIHGELRMLHAHARTAERIGIPAENIFTVENGHIIAIDAEGARVTERVPGGYVFVDGASVGEVGPAVMREREALGRDGVVVVVAQLDEDGNVIGRPEVSCRGFVFVRESTELLDGACQKASEVLSRQQNGHERAALENGLKKALEAYFYSETKRHPSILPLVLQAEGVRAGD
ncbi:MAG TPA: ribonuclease J [Anaerolineae bacterium]|nr:ribonuclease J [Anaerolineae bacterium]HOQ99596.1 ribonuclease J [Anaerolineae bacterium]HPL30256.1 ribonuclease J [Anaerolineae bacterium]